jgi:4-coumarate--CoA ligase
VKRVGGFIFFQGYGSTEAGGISLMIQREECGRICSAGRVSENVEVKIVDHVTGEALSVGQKGELLVRGPAVMAGNHQIRANTHDMI